MSYIKLGGVGERLRKGSGLRDRDLVCLLRFLLGGGAGDLDRERRLRGGVGDLLFRNGNRNP